MRWVFIALALGFVASAAFHVAGAIDPSLGERSPTWRHLLFAAINLAAAVGMVIRPRWFVFPFAILVAQQLYSHGSQALNEHAAGKNVDWASIVVVITMPLALILLLAWNARKVGRAKP